MTDLRTASQQLLGACEQRLPLKGQAEIIDELNNLRAALAEPKSHTSDDHHRDHWVAIAEAAQKIAASTECGPAEAASFCAAIERLGAALAEQAEPDSPARRCGGPGCDGTCCQPVAWRLWDEDPQGGGDWRYYDAKDFKTGIDPMAYFDGFVPLYTAPPQRPAGPVPCRYPDCVDNGPEGKCSRWLTGECEGPKIGGGA